MEGETPVPALESLKSLAVHQSTMAIFLSASLINEVVAALLEGGYSPETPAAVVYRATWGDEVVIRAPLKHLAKRVRELGIKKQAIILVGNFLAQRTKRRRSRLYGKEKKGGFRF
jgi:precorrin-4/cobalt-precorrin-4 C11-methyltransferase